MKIKLPLSAPPVSFQHPECTNVARRIWPKRTGKNNDCLKENKWLNKFPIVFLIKPMWRKKKVVTSHRFWTLKKRQVSLEKKKDGIFWAYSMSGTVVCISDSSSNLNIKTLWDRFYCFIFFLIFGKWAIAFLTMKCFSTFYYQPECSILGGSWGARSGLRRSTWTQNRVAGHLSDGDITGLNWNQKWTRIEDSKPRHKVPGWVDEEIIH